MLPEPSVAASSNALRSEPVPESFVLVTTRPGMLIAILLVVAVKAELLASVAVKVWLPTVLKTTGKMWTPASPGVKV